MDSIDTKTDQLTCLAIEAKTSPDALNKLIVETMDAVRSLPRRHRIVDDVLQAFAIELYKIVGQYDLSKGMSWRSFVFLKLKYFVKDFYRRRENHPVCNFTTRAGRETRVRSLDAEVKSKAGAEFWNNSRRFEVADQSRNEKRELLELEEFVSQLGDPVLRTILIRYYFHGDTMKQIAGILGLSESRVSQLHKETLKFLRTRLELAPA